MRVDNQADVEEWDFISWADERATQGCKVKVSLSAATKDQLMQTPNMGPGFARDPMNARPFGSWGEVSNIAGVGKIRLATLQSLFSLPTDISDCPVPGALGLNADPTRSPLEHHLIKWKLFARHTRRCATVRAPCDGLSTFLTNVMDRGAGYRTPDCLEKGLTCKGHPSSWTLWALIARERSARSL